MSCQNNVFCLSADRLGPRLARFAPEVEEEAEVEVEDDVLDS